MTTQSPKAFATDLDAQFRAQCIHLVGSEAPGALLRAAIDAKLLNLHDETETAKVRFSEEDDEPF